MDMGRRVVRAVGTQVMAMRPPQQARVLPVVRVGWSRRAQGQHVCRDRTQGDLIPRGLCVQAQGGVFHSLVAAQGPGPRCKLVLRFCLVGIGHCQR